GDGADGRLRVLSRASLRGVQLHSLTDECPQRRFTHHVPLTEINGAHGGAVELGVEHVLRVLQQWPDSPSGSATVWHACPLTVAWTATWPRDGSWLLAFSGSRRMLDPSMQYRVASKRTAGAASARLTANILSSIEHPTTWAAV